MSKLENLLTRLRNIHDCLSKVVDDVSAILEDDFEDTHNLDTERELVLDRLSHVLPVGVRATFVDDTDFVFGHGDHVEGFVEVGDKAPLLFWACEEEWLKELLKVPYVKEAWKDTPFPPKLEGTDLVLVVLPTTAAAEILKVEDHHMDHFKVPLAELEAAALAFEAGK